MMEIEKSVLLNHLEILQSVSGSSRINTDLSNKVIISEEGLINSFQGAFVTFIKQVFDINGVFDLPTFLNVIKSMNSDLITLEDNDEKKEIILSAGKTKVGLKKISIDNLDEIIESINIKKGGEKDLDENFLKALGLCIPCSSKGNTSLTNILIEKGKIVGSDNDKIGIYQNIKMDIDKTWLIENELASKIIKINPVKFKVLKNKVCFFRSDDIYSICSLSDVTFPDLDKIMEKKTDYEIPIPKELKEGIDLSIGLFSSTKEQEKLIHVSLLKNRVVLRTENDLGWMDKTIRMKYSDKEFSFWINSLLFKEMIEKSELFKISEERIARFDLDDFVCILPIEFKEYK